MARPIDEELSGGNLPPEVSRLARGLALKVAGPISDFLHVQAASGLVLLASAVVALAWANSPWAHVYHDLLHTQVRLGIGPYEFDQTLHFWINDGLMTIFFFVVGLEIRREIHAGELAELRRAILPVAGAVGGMILPAILYLAVNPSGPTRAGWGVPMATDIAFAVGVLALLGDRVPPALRVLLLSIAIIDDIGAILVIALFYSTGTMHWDGLALAGGGVLFTLALQRLGARRALVYVLPGAVVWAGILRAGIHPTIGGVIMGLLTPATAWLGPEGLARAAQRAIEAVQDTGAGEERRRAALIEVVDAIATARREAVSPAERLQHALHVWVAFVIMPVFALANAGVTLGEVEFDPPVAIGVALGLMLGKPAGVLLLSWLFVKGGLTPLPRGVTWAGVKVVGMVAGIGFTMAIFIAGLAFEVDRPADLATAKLAILGASLGAGVMALLLGRFTLKGTDAAAAKTPEEAESAAAV
jgi:NhaA family Na+:H+ antiporter